MAILWADNFDNWGTSTNNMEDGVYATTSTSTISPPALVTDPDANASGRALRFSGTNSISSLPDDTNTVRMVYPGSAKTTAGFAFRIYMGDLPSDNNRCYGWQLTNDNNERQVSFRVKSTGAIEVTRGNFNPAGIVSGTRGTIIGTSTNAITANAWTHIEGKVFLSDTVGTVELRVNGVTVLSLTGVDTIADATAATIEQFVFNTGYTAGGGGNQGTFWYIKDFILWDTSGTENTDFLGSCNVYTLYPDADTSFNWTASTGSTGYNLIDERTPADSDYISADNTPPAASTFSMSDLPSDIVSVKAVIPIVRARKTDGGDGNIQTGLTVNGATDLGSDRAITTAFTYWWDVSELSPDTSLSWTPTEVNNITFQLDRTL